MIWFSAKQLYVHIHTTQADKREILTFTENIILSKSDSLYNGVGFQKA